MDLGVALSGRAALARAARLLSRSPRIAADTPTQRKAFFKRAHAVTPFLGVETDDGLVFLVPTHDRLGRGVFAQRGRQDMEVLGHAVRILNDHDAGPEGSVFVDVGANLGTTIVTALRRYGFDRGVALEPEPGNFRTLRLNLVANDVDSRVTAMQVAVSDRAGETHLRVSSRSSGIHELVDPEDATTADDVIPVRAVTLDSLGRDGVIDHLGVGMLWVDAAGGEAAVLAGAADLLERGVPIVTAVRPTTEAWPDVRGRLRELLADYTHFASLRPFAPALSTDLEAVLAGFEQPGDVLAFRV